MSVIKPMPITLYAPWQYYYLMSEYYRLCHNYVAQQVIYKKNVRDLENEVKRLNRLLKKQGAPDIKQS